MGKVFSMVGGGGSTPQSSVFFKNANFTNQGSVSMVGGGKTYNGIFINKQVLNPEWVGLPSGYTQLEYIESTGTQYLNDAIPNADIDEVDAELTFKSSANSMPFGARGTNTKYYKYFIFWNSQKISLSLDNNYSIHGALTINTSALDINTKHHINSIIRDGLQKLTVDDVLIGTDSGTITQSSHVYPIYPLAYYYGGSFENYFIGLTHSLKAKLNGNLVRNYVPCINPSNEVGVYDLVSNTFYGNAGTGSFIAGPEVPQYLSDKGFFVYNVPFGTYTWTATQSGNQASGTILIDVVTEYEVDVSFSRLPSEYQELSYIESTGTQYIDSQIVFDTTNVGAEIKFKANEDTALMGALNDNFGGVQCGVYERTFYTGGSGSSWAYSHGDITKTVVATLIEAHTVPNWKFSLFGRTFPQGTYQYFKFQIYYAKLYKNNQLVRDFIPCYRKFDGEVGMYDLVSETFFTNQGTGVFIGGSPV